VLELCEKQLEMLMRKQKEDILCLLIKPP